LNEDNNKTIYSIDGRPKLVIAIPLGLQHVLAMFVSNMALVIILSNAIDLNASDRIYLLQMAMFTSGIVTLLQLYPVWKVGSRLPIFMGTSVAFLSVSILIAQKYGLPGLFGAALVGAIVEITLGFTIKYIRKFLTPIITGTIVLAIGFSLLDVGVDYLAGGLNTELYGDKINLLVGFITLFAAVLFTVFGKGMIKTSAILLGLVVGIIVAIPFGMIAFDNVVQADWVMFPIPLKYGLEFHWDAILLFGTIYIISTLETVGDCDALTQGALNREATKEELRGSILADGIGSMFSAVFNALPRTSYSQNVGIVTMTKVVNRFVVAIGAIILITAAFFPKIGAMFTIIPIPVLGGILVLIFGMVSVTGIRMISKTDLAGRDGLILAIALGIGFGVTQTPELVIQFSEGGNFPNAFLEWYFRDALIASGLLALILNIVLPKMKTKEYK